MALISAHNLHKRYGPLVVLERAALTVEPGEKIGLIGPNGCGKTTLLRIVAGLVEPDEGQVSIQRGTRVAYLAQVAELEPGRTVEESAREALAPLMAIERQAHELAERVAHVEDEAERDRLLHRHDDLLEHFRRSGGYHLERRLDRVLSGLGLDTLRATGGSSASASGGRDSGALRGADVATLSGGERTRVAVARLLLAAPDVMLLDEPTNHLDIEATEWLEAFLADYDGAAVIVSHDRYLLDRTVTRIVEMRRHRTYSYKGDYTAYEIQREKRVQTQWRAYHKQQTHIAHQEAYIRRYHAGQRAREARGRAKKLARLERIERPLSDPKAPILNFVPDVRGGDLVAEFRDVTKTFGSRTLFEGLTFTLTRGDRLAILGPNGAGKTTILRMLLGREPATAGHVRPGHNIHIGYADQEQADLDEQKTVIDEVWQVRPALNEGQMRTYLARFLFSGEDVFDAIESLSGGERARVALAKVMLAGPNLLLLDEPTNHLDILAREALEDALLEYRGTLVVVSHDRYFLNRLARTILHLEAGHARLYLGDYDFFREQRQRESAARPKPTAPPRKAVKRRRKRDRKGKPLHAQSLADIEAHVTAKEREFEALAALLGDVATYRDPDRARQVQADYDRVAAELEALTTRWEARVDEMDR